MEVTEAIVGTRRTRQYRTTAEKRFVVEATRRPGVSVATVARAHGVNANQVFQWRRLYRNGKLGATPENTMKLLPVSVVDAEESASPEPVAERCPSSGAIHIELPGDIRIGFARPKLYLDIFLQLLHLLLSKRPVLAVCTS